MSPSPGLPTPSYGGWYDYELWAEHGFRPHRPEDDLELDDDELDDPEPEAAEPEPEPEPAVEVPIDWPSRHDTHRYWTEPLPDLDPALLVRPYTRTGGRTHGCLDLAMETLVSVTESGRECPDLTEDHLLISRLCEEPVSVSEIAAGLGVPLNVVQVLIGDMAQDDLLFIHHGEELIGDLPSMRLLQRVLDGLHAL